MAASASGILTCRVSSPDNRNQAPDPPFSFPHRPCSSLLLISFFFSHSLATLSLWKQLIFFFGGSVQM